MSKEYHYRCKSNPGAPILTLNGPGEAKEMKNHPDYERIDACGELIVEDDELEGSIPFQGSQGRK